MGQPLIEIGLITILVAVLIGPFIAKKIEQNFEAYLLLMGLCAAAISRSWNIGIVEEAFQEPIVVGMLLSILVAGLILRYRELHSWHSKVLDDLTLKVIFFEIVVVLGLLTTVITPMIPFLVLVELANHLPIERRAKATLLMLSCISLGLGASLTLIGEPYSAVADMRMQGALYSANSIFAQSDLLSLYLMLGILALGLFSTLFTEKLLIADRKITSERSMSIRKVAIWTTRAFMFVGAIFLVGSAFGLNI